jgi:hypothetical protein
MPENVCPTDETITIDFRPTSGPTSKEPSIVESSSKTFEEDKIPPSSNEWVHSKYELGRRLVTEDFSSTNGEEAAVREVYLDETDGGAQENILFEGGAKFTDSDLEKVIL